MRIRCLHGYFIFSETEAGQFSKFISRFGQSIVSSGNHFTFEALADAPKYSIAGNTYLGALATVTYEGEPWEVMRQNELVFDFTQGLVVNINTITRRASILRGRDYYVTNGLVVPGSLTEDGERVKDYSAWYYQSSLSFKYSEVSIV